MKKKNKKHSIIIISIYTTTMIIFLIGSFIVNLPVLLLISIYALTITTLALQFNHWILNSLSIPFTFIYMISLLQDLIDMNLLFAIFHIPTVLSCSIIIWRKNTSLIIMVIMSFLYAIWIYAIKAWIYFPYYECIFGICDPIQQSVYVLLVALTTSYIGSIHFKTNIGYLLKKVLAKAESYLGFSNPNYKGINLTIFIPKKLQNKVLQLSNNLFGIMKNKSIIEIKKL